jgi:hypothetical protein
MREGPTVEKPSAVLARWLAREAAHPPVFAGDGALAYRTLIAEAWPDAPIVDRVPPLAPTIARLAEDHLREHGAMDPAAVRPIYVRRPDVELARDRAKS